MADFYIPSTSKYKKKNDDGTDSTNQTPSSSAGKASKNGFYTPSTAGYAARAAKDEQDRLQKEQNDKITKADAAKKKEDGKSILDRVGDVANGAVGFAKSIADTASSAYKRIGEGTAEVVNEVTGGAQKERDLQTQTQANDVKMIRQLGETIKNAKTQAEKDRAKTALGKIVNIGNEQDKSFQNRQNQIIERTDPVKAAGAVGSIGLDIITAGMGGAAGKALETGILARTAAKKATEEGLKIVSKETGKDILKNSGKAALIGSGYGVAQTAQDKGSAATGEDYLKSAATGAVIGAGVPLAGKVTKGGVKALTGTDKIISDTLSKGAEKVAGTTVGKKIADFGTKVEQKLTNNLAVVQQPFKNMFDDAAGGRQVNEVVRELATNVRQATGLAAARREANPAWQDLGKLLAPESRGPIPRYQARKEAVKLGKFISTKQDAINAAKTGAKDVTVPVGDAKQEQAYTLLNKATKDDVQYAFDNDLIPKDKYDNFMKDENYTRVQREMGDIVSGAPNGKGGAEASLSSTVFGQKLKGSTKQAKDPFTSYIDWSNTITEQVERKKFADYVIAQRQKLGVDKGFVKNKTETAADLIARGTPKEVANEIASKLDTNAGNDTLATFKKGIKQLYRTDPKVVDAIKNMDRISFGGLQKFVMGPARVLQAGATGLNFAFAVPNFIRDQVSSFVLSKNGFATHNPLAIFEGIKEAMLKPAGRALAKTAVGVKKAENLWQPSDTYKEFMSRNANMTSVDLTRQLKTATRQAYEELGLRGESPIRKLENINSATEKAGRYQNFMGTYRKAIKNGVDPDNALRQAQQAARENSVDFSQKGEWSSFMRIFNPYANAAIQGSRSLGRALKERPLATSAKIATTIMLPVAASTYYNLSDPERAAIYAAIPDYERKANVIFVLGGNRGYIKMPLPPGIKEFAAPLRGMIESEYLGDEQTFAETAKSLLFDPFSTINTDSPEQLVGNVIPQGIRPLAENALNKSFYTGKQIVPDYLKGEDTKDQVYKSTSQVYRDLGSLFGVSPLQVQNIIKGYGAGGSEQIVSVLDKTRKAAGGKDITADQRDTASQIVNRFYGQSPDQAAFATNKFYDTYTPIKAKRDKASRDVTALVKAGNIQEAKRKAEEFNTSLTGKFGSFNKQFADNPAYSKDLKDMMQGLFIKTTDTAFKARVKQ